MAHTAKHGSGSGSEKEHKCHKKHTYSIYEHILNTKRTDHDGVERRPYADKTSHLTECIEKLNKRAYRERKVDDIVDEPRYDNPGTPTNDDIKADKKEIERAIFELIRTEANNDYTLWMEGYRRFQSKLETDCKTSFSSGYYQGGFDTLELIIELLNTGAGEADIRSAVTERIAPYAAATSHITSARDYSTAAANSHPKVIAAFYDWFDSLDEPDKDAFRLLSAEGGY